MERFEVSLTRGNRRLDGSYGDVADVTCPSCGDSFRVDVFGCRTCGPAIHTDLNIMDDPELRCSHCGWTGGLEEGCVALHVVGNPYGKDCRGEDA